MTFKIGFYRLRSGHISHKNLHCCYEMKQQNDCIVLYCIVLYCIVLIVLYCIVLYCIVLYCIVLYCIVLLRANSTKIKTKS